MSDFVALVPEAERQRLVLEEWLESAEFDLMENGCRLYKNFREHVQPLLEVMGFQNSQEWGITLWRFSVATKLEREKTAPVHIIPIHVVTGAPEIVGKGLLKPGFKIVGNNLTIVPELDCLIIGRK